MGLEVPSRLLSAFLLNYHLGSASSWDMKIRTRKLMQKLMKMQKLVKYRENGGGV